MIDELFRDFSHLNKVISSPLKRTVETSSIIASNIKVPIELNSKLYEVGGLFKGSNIFKGATKGWFEKNYPDLILNDKGITDEGWYFENKIEGYEEGRIRTARVLEELRERALKCIFLKKKHDISIF